MHLSGARYLLTVVTPNEQDVKAAYKEAVKECHPDRHINSPYAVQIQAVERFKVGSNSVHSVTSVVFSSHTSKHEHSDAEGEGGLRDT